ncbi:hypothetical protein DJ480_10205 [Pseudomonas sp. Leaf98]|nr:hypothetical protein DJ480_10205 [Pseudomonas sp. Leaf98]
MGAGLPAMQATRYIRQTQLMPSQASQLPHKPAPTLDLRQPLAFFFGTILRSTRCANRFNFDSFSGSARPC